jgi:O-antigen/teichoic acid export membrane protein
MATRFLHHISSSTLQVLINQLSGVVIFFLLSKYFTKYFFGEINWCLAFLLLSFAILGFGIDQVTVKKIASGKNTNEILQTYLFHSILAGSVFIMLLLVVAMSATIVFPRINILLLLAAGQFFSFISSPFKQIANGKERFKILLWMSVTANIIKIAGIVVLIMLRSLTISSFIFVYCSAALIEFFVCLLVAKRTFQLDIRISKNWDSYKMLVSESLPQLGVIICNAAIARFDWVLLGIISSATILAEYSFAYKAFECSLIPLSIIGQIILPRVSRWITQDNFETKEEYLFVLARFEIIFATAGSLLLVMCWSPLIDAITDNKYGAVNNHNILLLSACVPFLYVSNIFWTLNFAKNRLKLILRVFLATFLVNAIGDLILIPFFQGQGAAIAFLTATITQTIYFMRTTKTAWNTRVKNHLIICLTAAVCSGVLVKVISHSLWIQIPAAIILYALILFLNGLILKKDFNVVKKIAFTN